MTTVFASTIDVREVEPRLRHTPVENFRPPVAR